MRIFRPKREEVTGGWRKLLKEDHHNLFSSRILFELFSQWGSRAYSMPGGKKKCILSSDGNA